MLAFILISTFLHDVSFRLGCRFLLLVGFPELWSCVDLGFVEARSLSHRFVSLVGQELLSEYVVVGLLVSQSFILLVYGFRGIISSKDVSPLLIDHPLLLLFLSYLIEPEKSRCRFVVAYGEL